MVAAYEAIGKSPITGGDVYVFCASQNRWGAWCRMAEFHGYFIDADGKLAGENWEGCTHLSLCSTFEEAYGRCLLHLDMPVPTKKSILEQALEVAEGW